MDNWFCAKILNPLFLVSVFNLFSIIFKCIINSSPLHVLQISSPSPSLNTISTSGSSWLLFESVSNHLLPCAHSWSCFSLSLPYIQKHDNVCPVLHSHIFIITFRSMMCLRYIYTPCNGSRSILFSWRLTLLIKRLFSIALHTILVIIKWLFIGGPVSWVSYCICWPVSVSLSQTTLS